MELRVPKVLLVYFIFTTVLCGSAKCYTSDKNVVSQYKQQIKQLTQSKHFIVSNIDVINQYRQQMNQIAQSKQFIGTSVIGGLMWPILLTLAVTATMARIPDILQRLLTGFAGGGGSQRVNLRSKRSKVPEDHLDEIIKLLGHSISKVERILSQERASGRQIWSFKSS
ncbi:hypothetical protein JTE90_022494 [Oedothorax gibbosus]|uniref:Uncharacterized protein n=1 Tax=Oedothorax gibbosus TaxID=931172 RepID=A0AAV6UZL3_9ARAC|nr:hypothetical protein JTE90_022494 [Oedothorax gibbosus]